MHRVRRDLLISIFGSNSFHVAQPALDKIIYYSSERRDKYQIS